MIYLPREDSYLLAEQVRNFAKGKRVLDVGTGSGILASEALKSGAKSVLGIDLNQEAVEETKKKGIDSIQSDLFEKVNGKFDLIVFNPPYLPADKDEDKESALATTGGEKGDEIILKFLKQAGKHLEKEGVILLLLSSLTPRKRINSLMRRMKIHSEMISSKKIFFEELEVWKISNV